MSSLDSSLTQIDWLPHLTILCGAGVESTPVVFTSAGSAVLTHIAVGKSSGSGMTESAEPSKVSSPEADAPSFASFTNLIAVALTESQAGSLSLREIHEWIKDYRPDVVSSHKKWKSYVRQALAEGGCFKRVQAPEDRSSTGSRWTLNADPSSVPESSRKTGRRNRKSRTTMKKPVTSSNPFELDPSLSSVVYPVSSSPDPSRSSGDSAQRSGSDLDFVFQGHELFENYPDSARSTTQPELVDSFSFRRERARELEISAHECSLNRKRRSRKRKAQQDSNISDQRCALELRRDLEDCLDCGDYDSARRICDIACTINWSTLDDRPEDIQALSELISAHINTICPDIADTTEVPSRETSLNDSLQPLDIAELSKQVMVFNDVLEGSPNMVQPIAQQNIQEDIFFPEAMLNWSCLKALGGGLQCDISEVFRNAEGAVAAAAATANGSDEESVDWFSLL